LSDRNKNKMTISHPLMLLPSSLLFAVITLLFSMTKVQLRSAE
jgi:hypothetical protein